MLIAAKGIRAGQFDAINHGIGFVELKPFDQIALVEIEGAIPNVTLLKKSQNSKRASPSS